LASSGSRIFFYYKLWLESRRIPTSKFPAGDSTPVLRLLEIVEALLLLSRSFLLRIVDGLEPLRKTVLVYKILVVLFRVWIASGPFSEVEVGVVENHLLVALVGYY